MSAFPARPAGEFLGARRRRIEALLHEPAGGFEFGVVGIHSDPDWLGGDRTAAGEWQIDARPVPALRREPAVGGDRDRIDWPAGITREHDHAAPGDARNLRH